MILTEKQLKAIYPKFNMDYLPMLNEVLPQYRINSKPVIAAFLAQVMVESKGFTKLRESLDYTPERLLEVFKTRVKTLENAKKLCAAGQAAIANALYGGRYGNGANNGDGYKYRGGGGGHLTFKDNYRVVGDKIGMDLVSHPELIETPEGAVKSFCEYWESRKCTTLFKLGWATPVKYDGIDRVSYAVNGGWNGKADRRMYFDKAMAVL